MTQWTNEQHDAYALGMQTEREHQFALARKVERMNKERVDDLNATIDALQAELQRLRAQLASQQGEAGQVAQVDEWEDVPDGKHDTGYGDVYKVVMGHTIFRYEHGYFCGKMRIPHDWRLQRKRAEGGQHG